MSDFMDSIFESVKIIVNKELENLSYDTTIVCRIIDDSECKNGKYKVSDGNVSYVAYSEVQDYKSGESVRVVIPNNDYSRRKFIVGRYGDEKDNIPITYVSSVDSIVNISGNIIDNESSNKTYGITANGLKTEKIIWNKKFLNKELEYLQGSGIYNTLILKADFQTLMDSYKVTKGKYGLRVDLLINPIDYADIYIRQPLREFTNEDMFGNSYSFNISSTQSIVIPLSSIEGTIEGIEVYLFQDNNFETIKYPKDEFDNIIYPEIDNILVRNLEIAFGSDLTNIADNILELYSPNSMYYNYNAHTPITNSKKIGAVWYNKTEQNKYLGFSDGIYDELYDEITYLTIAKTDERFLSLLENENLPRDQVGLQLAADLEDLDSSTTKILRLITLDLIQVLQALLSDMNGLNDKSLAETNCKDLYSSLRDLILKLVPKEDGSGFTSTIPKTLETMKTYYLDLLAKIAKKDKLNENEKTLKYDLSNIKNQLQNIMDGIENTLTSFRSNLKNSEASFYLDVFDIHNARIYRVINKINKELNKFINININEDYLLQNTNQTFEDYEVRDLSVYDNKYCIYLYKYNKAYEGTNEFDFLGAGWERIDPDPEAEDYIPFWSFASDDKYMNNVFCKTDERFYTEYLPHDTKEQKFKAILFYNHQMFISNELVFSNADEVPDEYLMDKADGLSIEHLENSTDAYMLYGESGYLKDGSQEFKNRQIRCHFNGIKLSDEDVFPEAGVYWYIPDTSMITYDELSLVSEQGFISDIESPMKYSREGYACFYKKIKYNENTESVYDYYKVGDYDTRDFWYQIRGYYEPSAVKNYIICRIITENGNDYETKIYFSFGFNGNSGTRYTVAITNKTTQSSIIEKKKQKETEIKPLSLKIDLRNANNESVKNYSLAANNIETLFSENDTFKVLMPEDNTTTENKDKLASKELLCFGSATCGIIEIIIPEVNIQQEGFDRSINLSQTHAVPWSNGDYYLSGVTRIIYNSAGAISESSMFNLPYRLFNTVTDEEIKGLSWRVKYYDEDGEDLEDGVYKNFLPKIVKKTSLEKVEKDFTFSTNITDNEKEKIPLNDYLIPAPFYLSGLGEQCFAVVEAYTVTKEGEKEIETIYWKQPLIIEQNRYESPMINEWDGSFTVDEGNNVIMSAMLGAGKKSEQNKFSGVLMGDLSITELKDGVREEKSRMIGLYGFYNGAQSFGFRADGTAFIGTSGSGRIEFNGASGYIQSSNYLSQVDATAQKKEPAGMRINLSSGHIDAYNFKLTSKHVYIDSDSDSNNSKPVYFQIKVPKDNGTQEYGNLMCVSSDEWYLQSYKYVEDEFSVKVAWPTLNGYYDKDGNFHDDKYYDENGNFVETSKTQSLTPGLKLDLKKGALQSVPESFNQQGGDNLGRLIINQFALGDTIALAVGDNFLVSGNGDFRLKGNWEIWAQNTDQKFDGSVGLNSYGVFCNRKLATNKKGETIWEKLTDNEEQWSSWEQIADVARRLKTMQLQMAAGETVRSLITFAGWTGVQGIDIGSKIIIPLVREIGELITSEEGQNTIRAIAEFFKMIFDGFGSLILGNNNNSNEE